ncbi:hypothetical protein GCM10025866_13500 [Naasia aerilata]|uniref:Uncharacterized protein n=1 Tax=Naasia aerilata TaxID=1162966 RepID=A0ABM8GB59_9MICO|nr:hypothetical protein GCM10025866_13500 [Naasia aerilata]
MQTLRDGDGGARLEPGARAQPGREQPHQRGDRGALGQPYGDLRGPVAEEVPLDSQRGDVPHHAELAVPGGLIAERTRAHELEALVAQVGRGGVENRGHPPVEAGEGQAGTGASRLRGERAEREQLVGTAGLGAPADGRALPPAERLALDDRTRDAAVDVEVAGLDGVEPLPHLVGVQGVQTRSETERDGVLELDGLLERGGGHDAEDRAEVLGEVEGGAGLHAGADAG